MIVGEESGARKGGLNSLGAGVFLALLKLRYQDQENAKRIGMPEHGSI